MKKIILLATALTAISSNVSADMMDSLFYVRADILGSQYQVAKVKGYKYKNKLNASFDAGFGYNFTDKLRAEILAIHALPAVYSHHGQSNYTSRAKANIDAIMVRGFVDIIDLEMVKIFAGVGVGNARVRHKVSNFQGSKGTEGSKFKYNVATNLILGASFAITSRTNMEFGYLHANYGTTKGLKTSVKEGQIGLRSHNIFLGIRHDL